MPCSFYSFFFSHPLRGCVVLFLVLQMSIEQQVDSVVQGAEAKTLNSTHLL